MNFYKAKIHLKRVILITFILLLCTSLTVFADDGGTDPDKEDRPSASEPVPLEKGPAQLVYTFTLPEFKIEQDAEGLDVISLEGFSSFGMPGEPLLPYKVYNIVLPPEAAFGSLTVEIVDVQTETLEGSYNIKPAVADMTETGLIAGGYQDEAPQPFSWVNLLPPGQMRKWKFARVEFNPVSYDSESGEITIAKEVTVELNYDLSSKAADAVLLADTAMDTEARNLFDNYQSAKYWYQTAGDLAGDLPSGGGPSRLVIITTEAISAGSTKIMDFYWHKWANRGLNPMLITETHYGGLTGPAPNGTAEKIRKWLQDNYITWGINYVLLIGDPDPASGDVPMKMVWPTTPQGYDEAPTDYYYADLTGNWNFDGDTKYGEWYGDYSGVVGGVDFAPEVYVGRIPVYGADYVQLDAILQKIMDYEMEVNPTWRNTALLPMSFSTVSYDGAPLAEQMMDDYLDSSGYSSWTQYQQGGGACALNSSWSSDQELRGGTIVRDRWAGIDYGMVTWWGHGSPTEAIVGCTGCVDGTLMSSSYATALDDDHPAFVYLNSCTNGHPETTNNLGYSLLKNGAIGTVSASRVSWFNTGVGYGDFDGSTTNSGIGYEFARRLNDYEYPAGMALYSAKSSMTPEFETRMMNFYDFNLYGDPTTSIADHAPPKVVINEVNVDDPDYVELYNYGATPVNLTGWNFRAYRDTDMTHFVFPSFVLPAGGYVVLHEDAGTNTATDLYFDDNIWWVDDDEGSAKLYDSDWIGVDFLQWDADTQHPPPGTGWVGPNPPSSAVYFGSQLGRAPNGVDTNYGYDWCLQNSSIGSQNTGCIYTPANFDNDWDTDISIFRPSTGYWYASGSAPVWWGDSSDWPVPGDYNGDGRTEEAVWRPSNGYWYIKHNDSYDYDIDWWGFAGDIPLPADYDGDGFDEIAVYRPSNGTWYVLGGSTTIWGVSTDVPLPCDYDGDGATDIAVFRPSTGYWLIEGMAPFWWGAPTDIPVPGDYDGDGDCDAAIWRPSTGYWYVKHDTGYTYDIEWYGFSTDIPVPADYDGDGDVDFAVLRPSTGFWYVLDPAITEWYYSPGDFVLPIRDSNGDGDPWH